MAQAGLASQLDQYLKSKGSPLAGLGGTFVSAGQRAGVDPRLLVAISGGETSFGKTGNATGLHNAWGWMGGPGGTLSSFPNWDAGINTIAQGLNKGYISQGLTTLPQIGAKWAPVGASNDPRNLNSNWVKTNSQFYNELGGRGVGVPQAPGLPAGPVMPSSSPSLPQSPPAQSSMPDFSMALIGSLGKGPGAQLDAIMGTLAAPLVKTPGTETSTMPPAPTLPSAGALPTATNLAPPANVGKWASLAPSADRSGARTNQSVLNAVARIARVHGKPLTISTGTNHNQYVVNTNRESQHWQGNAADISFGHGTGSDNIDPALTALGQQALIAAGMNPAEARKQQGGVFNVGGWQILFNTYTGGNHYNHLHVGV